MITKIIPLGFLFDLLIVEAISYKKRKKGVNNPRIGPPELNKPQ